MDEDEFDDFTEQREAPALPQLSGMRNIRGMSGLKIYNVINRNIFALLNFFKSQSFQHISLSLFLSFR